MSINATEMISVAAEVTNQDLDYWEHSNIVHLAFYYILLPGTSVLGIIGNVISIVILSRQGFQKCSRILLMALAVADILYLTGINNFSMYIYFENDPQGFLFPENVNKLFSVLSLLFYCCHIVGLQSAMLIPVLITGERILAIFFPLSVNLFLTPRCTAIALSCIYVFNAAYFVYAYILCLQFKQIAFEDRHVGLFAETELFDRAEESGLNELIQTIFNNITGIIPISLVIAGCIVIGIKVILITNRRKQLTSSQIKLTTTHGISKTTKTLFSICLLFIVCNGVAFVCGYVSLVQSLEENTPLKIMLGCLQEWLMCLNCVGDFIIYVGANNNFRKSDKSGKIVLFKK